MQKKGLSVAEKLNRFLKPLKGDKSASIRYFIVYGLRPVFGIFSIIMIEIITKNIEQGNKESFLISLLIFFIGSIIIHLAGIILRDRGWPHASTLLDIHTYEPVVKQILRADNTKFERLGTGKVVAIVNSGLDTRNRLLTSFIQNVSSLTLTFCFTIYLMYRINFWFILVFIVILTVVSIIVVYANNKTVRQRNISRDLYNDRTRRFVRISMSKFEILQSNKMDYEIDSLNKNTYERYLSEKKRSLVTEFIFKTPEFGGFLLRFLIFMIIGYGIFGGTFSYSELVMFSGALSLIDGVISNFVNFYFNFTSKFNQLDKLWETLDDLKVKQDFNTDLKPFKFRNGDINIKNVDFIYYKTKVFDNFSVKIQGGKTTAFVGESGGGKTTLIKLLAGYIVPNEGYVSVDSQNINNVNKIEYYKHIGYLPQEPSVFDGTIYENLVYALDYEPTEQQLEDIIKLSKCEFIWEFKDGLNAEIGERGILLSGGQKQRLAIAKIMLKNPDIVLLDEPTAALDSINEEGTHKELIKLNGKYKKMLDLQSGF